MKQEYVVPSIAAVVWGAIMWSGVSNDAQLVRVIIVANLAVCIVFMVAAIFNIARIGRR